MDPSPQNHKEAVRRFRESDEKVIVFPFECTRCDVSKHWHSFLEQTPWQLLKKSFVLAVTRYMASGPLKNALLRTIGVKIGKNVFIAATVELDIQFPELITIEDGAIMGMHSHVTTHEVTHTHIRLGKVHIGKNALVGGQATVRSGVTIGENSVVAMRAFVTESVPPNTLVTGVPDRKVTHLNAAP
jgi:acetyltransferase-like isoleucine patch superfamily enzyme